MKAFEPQPHLAGELLELRPLRRDDWAELFAAASDPLIWEQHPASNRYQEEVFRQFFEEALDGGGAFAVVDRKTGKIIGSSRYFGYDREHSEIEIGWTFLARSHWGGTYNRELKRLMIDHALQFVDNVVFLVGPKNFRSQKAMQKIGGVLIGARTKTDRLGRVSESLVFHVKKTSTVPPIPGSSK